jgi:hypothetical protein
MQVWLRKLVLPLVIAVAAGLAWPQEVRVGEIDFFRTEGVNVQKVQSLLPVRKGDEL